MEQDEDPHKREGKSPATQMEANTIWLSWGMEVTTGVKETTAAQKGTVRRAADFPPSHQPQNTHLSPGSEDTPRKMDGAVDSEQRGLRAYGSSESKALPGARAFECAGCVALTA